MATSKEYLHFVLDQFSGLGEVTHRAMMGEYVLYYRQKVIGGIYDNRVLVKPTPSAKALMPEAREEIPYEGAKAMLMVERLEEPAFLQTLLEAMYAELPQPKPKKKKKP